MININVVNMGDDTEIQCTISGDAYDISMEYLQLMHGPETTAKIFNQLPKSSQKLVLGVLEEMRAEYEQND